MRAVPETRSVGNWHFKSLSPSFTPVKGSATSDTEHVPEPLLFVFTFAVTFFDGKRERVLRQRRRIDPDLRGGIPVRLAEDGDRDVGLGTKVEASSGTGALGLTSMRCVLGHMDGTSIIRDRCRTGCEGQSNGASTVVPDALRIVDSAHACKAGVAGTRVREGVKSGELRNPVPEENANPAVSGSNPTVTVVAPAGTGAVVPLPTTAVPQS